MARTMRRPTSVLMRYGAAAALLVAADGVHQVLPPATHPGLWILPYILAVALGSWAGGFGPGLLATIGAAWLAGDALQRPTHWLGIAGAGEALGLVAFVGICLFIDVVFSADRSPWQPF